MHYISIFYHLCRLVNLMFHTYLYYVIYIYPHVMKFHVYIYTVYMYICIHISYTVSFHHNPSSCGGDSDASCGCRWRLLLLLGSGISSVALRPGAVSHSPWRSFNESSAHIHLHNFQTAKRRISKWTLRSVR